MIVNLTQARLGIENILNTHGKCKSCALKYCSQFAIEYPQYDQLAYDMFNAKFKTNYRPIKRKDEGGK